jgi:hypothetical protein
VSGFPCLVFHGQKFERYFLTFLTANNKSTIQHNINMADRISDAELEQKVNEVYKFNIDGQAKFFLKQFVMDFFGKFEEVIIC